MRVSVSEAPKTASGTGWIVLHADMYCEMQVSQPMTNTTYITRIYMCNYSLEKKRSFSFKTINKLIQCGIQIKVGQST